MPKYSRYEAQKDQIAELAGQGLTAFEILERLGLEGHDPEALRKFLRRQGIPRQPRGARPGEKNHAWNGGVMMVRGYRFLKRPDHPRANHHGYYQEHRLVMEAHLGRHLETHEVVHHINGDPQDNRIENLELFASNAAHLAATLKGQCPSWTAAGRERLESLAAHRRGKPQTEIPGFASLAASGSGDTAS